MTATKELELVLRARDLASAAILAPARAAKSAANAALELDQGYTRLITTQVELERRQERLIGVSQRYVRIQNDEKATARQRQQAGRALTRIYGEQAAAARRLADTRRQLDALPAAARQTLHTAVDQGRLAALRAQAAVGNQQAVTELRVHQLLARQRTERAALTRLARSDLLAARDRARAQRELNALTRAHALELQRARRAGGGLHGIGSPGGISAGRAVAGGLAGGLTAAGANPLLGIGAGAAITAGGPVAAAAIATGATAFGGAQAVREAANYEAALNRVLAITEANTQATQRLDASNRDLGRTTVFTAQQAAEAQQNLAIAGFDVNQILDAQKPVLDLAAAGQLDLAESAKIVARIMAGMKVPANEVGGAVDLLAFAFTNANTDLSELGTAFSFVGPIAHTTGQTIEGTTAAVMALSDAGLAGEKAGTASRQILIKLADATGDAKRRLDELGISTTDARGNLLPLVDIVAQFEDKLGGLGSGERLQVLSQIFEARAAAGFAVLMDRGADSLRNIEDRLGSAAGTADRVSKQSLEGLSGQTVRLQSAVSGLGIELGSLAIGPANDAVLVLTDLTNAVTDTLQALRGGDTGSALGLVVQDAQQALAAVNSLGGALGDDAYLTDLISLGALALPNIYAELRRAQQLQAEQEQRLHDLQMRQHDERMTAFDQESQRKREVFEQTGEIIHNSDARQQLDDIDALNRRGSQPALPNALNAAIDALIPRQDLDELAQAAQLLEDLGRLERQRLFDLDEARRLLQDETEHAAALERIRARTADVEKQIALERNKQAAEIRGDANAAIAQSFGLPRLSTPHSVEDLNRQRQSLEQAANGHIDALRQAQRENAELGDQANQALDRILEHRIGELGQALPDALDHLTHGLADNLLEQAQRVTLRSRAADGDTPDARQARDELQRLAIADQFAAVLEPLRAILEDERLGAEQRQQAEATIASAMEAQARALERIGEPQGFQARSLTAIRAEHLSRFNFDGGQVNNEANDRKQMIAELRDAKRLSQQQTALLRALVEQGGDAFQLNQLN
ncbi:MAG: phage tail tape measure protein [Planctomycetota bacterium]